MLYRGVVVAAVSLAAVSYATAVPTCDDVKSAIAASKKFPAWRAKKLSDKEWETTHTIFGFTKCNIVNSDFRCTRQTSGSQGLAEVDYATFNKLIEGCLPAPRWKHTAETGSEPSHKFLSMDGESGYTSLTRNKEIKLGTLEFVETNWIQITIFEHF